MPRKSTGKSSAQGDSYLNYEPLGQYSNRYMFVLAAQSKPFTLFKFRTSPQIGANLKINKTLENAAKYQIS